MRSEFLPFSRPSITDADIAAVVDVLRSRWITTGPKAAEFERKFAEYLIGGQAGSASKSGGSEIQAIAMASATGAMHVMLKALDIGPGDEVITPSLTWVSTINLIVLAGATPVFVDVDRDTLMVSPSAIEAAVTPRTKVVIPVHYAGAAADIGPMRQFCEKRGIALVEDAAHALGTEYHGERIGNRGITVFSFHPIKNITTGEGGMVCCEDESLANRVRRLKFHGLGVDAFDRQMQGRSPQAETIEPGYKYNMPDMSAALGLSQMARVDEMNKRRGDLAMYYRKKLADVEEVAPLADPPYPMKHSWHLFIVRVTGGRSGITREDFMEALKKRNIGTGIHFRAAHMHKYYVETMGMRRGMLPNTEWNSDRICSLPLFPDMTQADVDDVVAAIKDVFANPKAR
ncbi:MAG: UDP-4-amino-4-deoxy-L-arabinose aminotransferase [Planctomycetes bacterium]|nr:UDP-4-amino-4-deoxy-L-arabinose aminotransferase [Planctomycetota bacterium]MBI3833084.1 UDP-4-amino-4-deoxy-L-arabinose aminotransferase [Planctomycetota bacterium]